MKYKDITGQRFGRLVVLEYYGQNKDKSALWRCRCDCGKEKVTLGVSLRNGSCRSCGCLQIESAIKLKRTHGLSGTPEYVIWEKIVDRCYNNKNKYFRNYGGRGIQMCDEWRTNPDKFIAWLRSSGWEKGLEIDRIDNNLGYNPENCRVVTRLVNTNNRRNTKRFPNGVSIADACRMVGINTRKPDNNSVSDEYNKISKRWSYSNKLHPIFIDACVNKHICPHKFLLKGESNDC